jgi:hypothetical protein
MIEIFIGRLLLGWLRAIERRHSRFTLVPVIPGSAELIPGSPEKLPGSSSTGISPQPIDSAHVFLAESAASRPNPRNSRLNSRLSRFCGNFARPNPGAPALPSASGVGRATAAPAS